MASHRAARLHRHRRRRFRSRSRRPAAARRVSGTRTPAPCAWSNDKIKRMRPLNQAVPGALAELLRAAPLSPGKVGFAWRTAVGPAMDRVTSVRLEGRALVVAATGPQWAREIARSSAI